MTHPIGKKNANDLGIKMYARMFGNSVGTDMMEIIIRLVFKVALKIYQMV